MLQQLLVTRLSPAAPKGHDKDDLAAGISSVNLNDKDYSRKVKDPWKRSRHLITRTDLQFCSC